MKCVLTTREEAERSVGSLVVLAAIRVMLMLDVLVASIVCGAQTDASREKMLVLRSGISYTGGQTAIVTPKRDMRR